ncbi:TetR family transcriptional regulator [Paenibacillus sp. PK3_47]|uniref:TetR/AcrR family transcriptional regulator n=1 Tax=Paenibacillus sp. PK3_47 TaxID=2072642 RepID=UPI00201E1C39|nr:TetR/AcrR family transcriptional regulator [Paenibacillus sp. PK3_47]UQZ36426.1 TetR family transcriptional regulator [Paenibacillus sp. PK3_47]
MPKLVNHEERRRQLAEAAWRIIRREGMEGVSVRSVAQEAGMSLGSLRHYFDTQSELLAFSMKMVSDQVNARMEALEFTDHPVEDIERFIGELMPLDDERHTEAEVWLAFSVKAVTVPELQKLQEEVHSALYEGFTKAIYYLAARGMLKEGVDQRAEAMKLHALVDGLVLHHTTRPEQVSREDIAGLVSSHVRSLLQ